MIHPSQRPGYPRGPPDSPGTRPAFEARSRAQGVSLLPNDTTTLRQVEGLSGVTTLGSYGSVALKSDGSVWVWEDVFSPTKIPDVPPMTTALRSSDEPYWGTLFMVSR